MIKLPKTLKPYKFTEVLGKGKFGVVLKGVNTDTREAVAAKMIQLRALKKADIERIHREIHTLRALDCEFTIKLYGIVETVNHLYLITEYCAGGDLLQFTKNLGKINEDIAKKWIKQIIQGLLVLRDKNIMHRDLKPANILLTDKRGEGEDFEEYLLRLNVKIADFGFSKEIEENSCPRTFLGTPYYMAPEIIRKEAYSFSADIWSLGVLCYRLLLGTLPYQSDNLGDLLYYQGKPVEFPLNSRLSCNAVDFIQCMLVYEPELRYSLNQLLDHDFFRESDLNFTMTKSIIADEDLAATDARKSFADLLADCHEIIDFSENLYDNDYGVLGILHFCRRNTETRAEETNRVAPELTETNCSLQQKFDGISYRLALRYSAELLTPYFISLLTPLIFDCLQIELKQSVSKQVKVLLIRISLYYSADQALSTVNRLNSTLRALLPN